MDLFLLCADESGQSRPTEDSSHHDESFVPKSLVDCLRRYIQNSNLFFHYAMEQKKRKVWTCGINFGFSFHLGCSGQNAIICNCEGLL